MKKKLKDLIVRVDVDEKKLMEYLEQNEKQKLFKSDILDNRVKLGMSIESCIFSWGVPLEINTTTDDRGERKILSYCPNPTYMVKNRAKLTFENGLLVSINNRIPCKVEFDYELTQEESTSDLTMQYQYIHDKKSISI